MISVAVLAPALGALLYAAFGSRTEHRWAAPTGPGDLFTLAWVLAITAWPAIVIYTIAPLLWTDAAAAGPLFPILSYAPATAISLLACLHALSADNPQIDVAAGVVGALLLSAAATTLIDGSQHTLNMMLAVALFLGLLVRWRTVRFDDVAVAARLALVLFAGCLLLSVLVNGGQVVGACRIDKCTELQVALTSPFAGNGNLAGITVAALLPLALYRLTTPRAVAAIGGAAAIGVLAGSRAALIAVAATGLVGLVLCVSRRPEVRRLVIGAFVIAAAVFSLLPFYARFTATDFSFRGALWAEALTRIPDQLLFGHHPGYWVEIGESLPFRANYSPHNGWLEPLLSVGVWGTCLIVVSVILKVRGCPPPGRDYLIVYFATITCINSLEAIYVPYYLGITPFVAIVPFLVYQHPAESTAQPDRRLPGPGGGDALPRHHALSEKENP